MLLQKLLREILSHIRWLMPVSLALLTIGWTLICMSGCSGDNSPIEWKDAAVEEAFRLWLDIPSGDIYKADLDDVTEVVVAVRTFYINANPNSFFPEIGSEKRGIYYPSSHIADLSDFANCRNLSRLELFRTSLPELTGIKNLSKLDKLTWLRLSRNVKLNDIKGLSYLSKLEYLEIHEMDLKSFDELAKLKSLKTLSLMDTNIDDFKPVGKLKQLNILNVRNVPATDLRPLKQLSNLTLLHIEDEDGAVINDIESIPE